MFGRKFELNEATFPVIEELGAHMPGGFFIYRAEGDGEILYANRACFDIFGCQNLEEFQELTGYTFRGMVHQEDYDAISRSITEQIDKSFDNMDHVEYRIIQKDGSVRWVDDYGHYAETEQYGGVYDVFISDITEKRQRMEEDMAVRQAVIEALSKSYHTMWLINDVETETFSLYRGDVAGKTTHAAPIRAALQRMKYSQAKEYYIQTSVAESDQERLQKELSLHALVERLNETEQFNINYLRKMEDGSEKYFRIEFAKMEMPGGRMGIVCAFKDVDADIRQGQAVQKALREAEEAEKENQRLMEEVQSAAKLANLMASVSSLLTNMPAMSFSKDAETGVYLACNQAFAEYANKETPDEVIGLTDYEIFDPETAAHFVEDDQRALAMDDAYVFFEDVPDASGKNFRNLQTTKTKFTDHFGRLCLLGMCVDVTEMTRIKTFEAENRAKQQELEERLALQEQLLEQEKQRKEQDAMITAMASDYRSVYHVDIDHDDAVCYRADASDANQTPEGVHFPFLKQFTKYCKLYVDPDDQEGFLRFIDPDHIRAALDTENIIAYRYLAHRNGQDYYEMLRMAGVRHAGERDDHTVHAVGVGFTVIDAEMRETLGMNRALKEALAEAEHANKAKTAFLSNMSHEIRTPMNAIIGLNNIALNEPDVPEKIREYLKKIGESAQHLLGIINDILDMSRIESGRMTIKNEEFSFSDCIEQVNTIINGQCRDKGLTYTCQMEGTIDHYYIGDSMKLKQVLINILGNAVKFTPEGGKVSWLIEEGPRYGNMATLKFTISDTGIGMSEEYLPHIFETFSQEDSSSTGKYGSTGLGMPITKSIVELMNGQIQVESEKGVGSTFTVTVTLGESGRKSDAMQASDISPEEMRVLVIDDDPIALDHAQIILGQVGISCETAASGLEGLEMVKMRHARREEYTLVLIDWRMPEMDGLETTRQIRAVVGHDIPIIILTSFNWDEIEDEAREAGVDTFVPKPLFAENVMNEFREAFKRKNEKLAANTVDLEGRRVLLAEDMDINAEIMVMVLSMRSIDVDVAQNGRIAVEKFEQSPEGWYDAILMDMRMPEMDGLEATRCIRGMERADAGSIPIIALTANAFDEDVQRSMQAGLNAHLSKPVEPEALFDTLESLIGNLGQ